MTKLVHCHKAICRMDSKWLCAFLGVNFAALLTNAVDSKYLYKRVHLPLRGRHDLALYGCLLYNLSTNDGTRFGVCGVLLQRTVRRQS